MSGVDGFVVFKGIIADFSEFVSVKVGTQIIDCAVEPVLGIPVLWCAYRFLDWCGAIDFLMH